MPACFSLLSSAAMVCLLGISGRPSKSLDEKIGPFA
jgi:hypothetical protein